MPAENVSIEVVAYGLPDRWAEKPPPPAGMAELVRRFGAVVAMGAPALERLCSSCHDQPAEAARKMGMTNRICDQCLDAIEDEAGRAAEIPATPDGEGGLSIPIEVSPARLLAQSRKLRDDYDRDPRRYWRMLLLLGWVALGQLGLFAGTVLILSILVLGGGLAIWLVSTGKWIAIWVLLKVMLLKSIKLAILGLVALTALAASIASWFKPARMELHGCSLTRERAPELFRWLDELAARVGAPAVDLVVVDTSLNAGAAEKLVGRHYRRVVTVGVPTLEISDVAEMESVMAHELAHLRHEDTRSRWVYRTAEAWSSLARDSEGVTRWLARFAKWYIPQFMVRAQVVIRAQEREADRRARTVVSNQVQARELVKIHTVARLFWRRYPQLERSAPPP